MNRAEHLQWCKDRALQELESSGTTGAIASMQSDMSNHEETAGHSALGMGMKLLIMGQLDTPTQMKEWIIGFN